MVLGPRLDLRQSQSLVMTPQLQQAIKLLQMSNIELSEFIEQEIEENPLLEREDIEGGFEGEAESASADSGEDQSAGDGDSSADDFDSDTLSLDDPAYDDSEFLPDAADHATSESMGAEERALDTDYENVYEPESASDGAGADAGQQDGDGLLWNTSGASGGGGFDDELSGMENIAANETTLRDHLIGQINVDFTDTVDVIIAGRLMDMLDDNGWLSGDLEPVAVALGCTIDRVHATLAKCQQFDPPGIFARSLSECLALQLREKDRLDPA
ncbi:MAG: RNA polymerase sigma-54 factor, partial [Proteobacteria bacterium]|nr:RNA polymerase sigma-54 factor [Pseudomonadota bacterium]